MNLEAASNSDTLSPTGEASGQSSVISSPVATTTGPDTARVEGGGAENAPPKADPAPPSAPVGESLGELEVPKSSLVTALPGAAPPEPLEEALAALDRKDYATAQRLFEGLGRKGTAAGIEDALAALARKDYASAHRLFEALGQMSSSGAPTAVSQPAPPALFKPAPSADVATEAKSQLAPLRLEISPQADRSYHRPATKGEKPRQRRLSPAWLGAGVAIAVAGAFLFFSPQARFALARYGGPLKATYVLAKSGTEAGLASAAGVLKAPLDAMSGPREEERAGARDLSAALTQLTIRQDQIERDYAARLDKLGERVNQDASYRVPDIVQRLDRLEQKTAAPAPPVSEFADLAARLDRLEKRAAVTAAPAPDIAEITARLDKLDRRAAIAVAPSELTAVTTRLDKLEKRLSVAAASSPLPPTGGAPRPATLVARADPSPPFELPRTSENAKPLLRNFSLEEVRDGVAVVASREGPQQVGPGDLIPGAGRVLRIERRNGDWFVVTSVGVIASDPSSY